MHIIILSRIENFLIKMLFSLLLISISLIATAQTSQGAKDSALAEIKQLTNEWNRAIIQHDFASLEKILAAEYTLNGTVSRSGWLANVKRYTTDSLHYVSDLNITFHGGAAKVQGILYWKRAWDARPVVSNHSLVTDIWIKRDGRWQVLIRMSSNEWITLYH